MLHLNYSTITNSNLLHICISNMPVVEAGPDPEWGDRPPPKTCKSNFIHHDFVQFGKQRSQYKTISLSIVWSQHSFVTTGG